MGRTDGDVVEGDLLEDERKGGFGSGKRWANDVLLLELVGVAGKTGCVEVMG